MAEEDGLLFVRLTVRLPSVRLSLTAIRQASPTCKCWIREFWRRGRDSRANATRFLFKPALSTGRLFFCNLQNFQTGLEPQTPAVSKAGKPQSRWTNRIAEEPPRTCKDAQE